MKILVLVDRSKVPNTPLRHSVQGILKTQPDTVRPEVQCLQECKNYECLV